MGGEAATALGGLDWLLLAFAAFWFCVGLLDELAIDLAWISLKLTGKARTTRLPVGYSASPLAVWHPG